MAINWDEPEAAHTPRGWLRRDGTVVGFYLDYGPDHYRSPHKYCQPAHVCPQCQPGTILAVRYPGGTDALSHYEAEARAPFGYVLVDGSGHMYREAIRDVERGPGSKVFHTDSRAHAERKRDIVNMAGSGARCESHWFETVERARAWVEDGETEGEATAV